MAAGADARADARADAEAGADGSGDGQEQKSGAAGQVQAGDIGIWVGGADAADVEHAFAAAEAAKNDIQLDADDVARCVDPFPVAPFLEFDEPSTCRSPWAKAFSFPDEDPPPPKPWYGEL